MRERVYKAMVNRYQAQMEESLLKIDMLMLNSNSNSVMVDHTDITGEIDKLLAKVAVASERLEILKRFYSTN
jgi:superfamily II helicase